MGHTLFGQIQLEVYEHNHYQQNTPLSVNKIIVSHEVRVPVNENRTKKNWMSGEDARTH